MSYDRTQSDSKPQGTPISLGAATLSLRRYMAALTERDRFIAMMEQFLANWDAWLSGLLHPLSPIVRRENQSR